jgi:alkylation response protein AidB-like acyl-CoA dehydrogenase
LLADLDGEGVDVRPIRASGGRNEFAEVHFAEHPVPRARLIGDENAGWSVAMYLLQWERGMYAWQRQAMLRARLDHALERFRPAARRPGARSALAECVSLLAAVRARAAATVRALAAGESVGPAVSVDKVLLARAEQAVMQATRLLAGPDFVLGQQPADEVMRGDWFYSRAASIYGGSAEIQRSIVAEHLLGLPRSRT